MDPHYSAQDVLRCYLCDTPVPPMYCEVCDKNLCKPCVGEHISDRSKEHKVLPYEERGSTPKCPKHSTKLCELHCEQCNIPICIQCLSSEHKGHEIVEIMNIFTNKKDAIRRDLQELENSIYPQYQTAASKIPGQKSVLKENSKKLTADLKKQREILHTEIDAAIQKIQTEIDDKDSKSLAAINKQEDAIHNTITEIEQNIADIKKMLDSDDVYFISAYKSRNEEFRSLPGQFQVTLPTFTPQEINREQIYQQIGSLSKLAITTEEHGGLIKTAGAVSSLPARLLLDKPRILTDIQTEYRGLLNRLHNVSCLSDSELWTCSYDDKIMRLYNLKGKLLKSVQTKSGNHPYDIAVTRSGDLVYTDYKDRSINLVSDTQIQTLITLRGSGHYNLCITSSGDFLVTMITDDNKQTKVVRYSGSTEKQSIQWDEQGKPLYSSGGYIKYLVENRNLDICMADYAAGAVVVVSASGKLRFRYTGPPSDTKKSFKPYGITTDSQSKILTADYNNHRIHILDQDGQFLRYIDNCGLQRPWGLCVDSRDNLFVAECHTGKVKKILYFK